VQRIVAASLHEATYWLLPDQEQALAANASEKLLEGLAGYDALLIGPGLGRAQTTQDFFCQALGIRSGMTHAQHTLPSLIIDADGLNALSTESGWWQSLPAQSVLTPHVGEFARLTKLTIDEIASNREGCGREFARQWNQIVLLKGAFTLIAEPNAQVTLLPFANPALATAGSGDVLAGIIVGLMAQGLAPRHAAIAGGYVHGVAGELARAQIGDAGVIASDLLLRVPSALKQLKQNPLA
jgi:NAD(P)H-hydrate epimerase